MAVDDKAIAVLEAKLARVLKAQYRAWRQEIGTIQKAKPNPPSGDDAALMKLWLAAWDRAAKRTQPKLMEPIMAAADDQFGEGGAIISAQAAEAIKALKGRPSILKLPPLPSPVLAIEPTPVTSIGITFSARDPRAAKYLEDNVAERVAGIDATTRTTIGNIIKDGMANGDSPAKIAEAIGERFSQMGEDRPQEHVGSRAHGIALTEMSNAYNAGQLAGAKEMASRGLDFEKSWLTVGDNLVSEECSENEDEEWIPLDQDFSSGDPCPCAHPYCRCSLLTRVDMAQFDGTGEGGAEAASEEDDVSEKAMRRLMDLPLEVRKRFKPSAQNAMRRAHNAAIAKDGPTVSAVHVDAPMGAKPKRPRKGRILKQDDARRYTLGVVYEPDVVDTQDDFATAEEIEQACWDFNRNQIGNGRGAQQPDGWSENTRQMLAKGALGVQHGSWLDSHGEIIESYIAPADMTIGDEKVTAGTWLMGTIWSPDNWAKVQRGEITGFSLGGRARRESA